MFVWLPKARVAGPFICLKKVPHPLITICHTVYHVTELKIASLNIETRFFTCLTSSCMLCGLPTVNSTCGNTVATIQPARLRTA